jgi:hypothetical protein
VRPRGAFRWHTHRGGVGLIGGTLIGLGFAGAIASRQLLPLCLLGGATTGHIVGRRIGVPRCSACASVVPRDATVCGRCRAQLRGDIATLAERLDAEEKLEDQHTPPRE